jgi:hypothetical protein
LTELPERWRPIPGHRGYEASSEGQVRSVARTLRDGRTAGGTVLAQQEDRDGYRTVKLGARRVRVNVAVQLAFAGPPEVRHLDGNRENNRPGNLAWGSRTENEQDKRRKGKQVGTETGCSRPFPVGTTPVTGVTDAG